MDASSDVACPASLPIPIDLFGSKKHKNLPRGELGFVDSSGKPVFRVLRQSKRPSLSSSSPPPRHDTKLLLDAAGNPIFSIVRGRNGSWQIFKVDHGEEKALICNVQRTRKSLTRTELEVLVIGESCSSLGSSFKMKGFPFQKSCTIYQGDSIVAQTSLMYKLHQIYVKRGKFRLTIYPGSVDHAFIVTLVANSTFFSLMFPSHMQDAVQGKFHPMQLLGSAMLSPSTSDKSDHMRNMKYLLVAE